ncbi:MAG: hypothetical protein H0X66_07280 [Verrucomicrobia bacterium]|nr:hypothetical protein [Verrucomicrobiota bacterium]
MLSTQTLHRFVVNLLTLAVILIFGGNALAQSSSRLELLWQLAPFSRPYLTTNELPFERGMAYNPITHRVLIASWSNRVHVVNAANGSDLHELNMTGVGGAGNGHYPILLIKAADDGAIYAGNLNTSTANPKFRLYRWANDNPDTIPTLAFSGDPSPGSNKRWGDSLTLRGAGTNTQVLLTPRDGSLAALLTTADGLNFTSSTINLTDTPSGYCALGLAFGPGNTFYGTTHTNPLREITFDIGAGTGITSRLYNNAEIPTAISPIGINPGLKLLAGIHVFSPNHLRVYDLSPTNGVPVLIGSTSFPSDNPNTHTAGGSVEFGTNTVYALDANNGLMAVRIVPPPLTFESISVQTGGQILLEGRGWPGNYLLEISSSLNDWSALENTAIGTNGIFEYLHTPTNSLRSFYRVKSL